MLIRLENSGRSFDAAPNEPILDAAERAGLALPYSCRDGICGTCKARLNSGSVDHGFYAASALTEEERAQGYFLMCCSSAQTDLVVDAPSEELGFAPSPIRMACQVSRIERPTEDVAILQLGLPTGVTFRFRAGQYVEIVLDNGVRRSFSVANAPHDTAIVELHIRRVANGAFTPLVFDQLKEGDPLIIEGPKGGFFLRDEHRPVILLASGTGFAPIKSMVLDALRRKLQGPATLYWGGRRLRDLYMVDLPAKWAQQYPAFHFAPVLSDADAADAWSGRTGLVHQAVMADFTDLSGHDVYACGVPAMVEAARRDFVAHCGLPPERFFADLFLTAADRARVQGTIT
jgi:CDP-4-dehydro-6-deoxyglucose reductase